MKAFARSIASGQPPKAAARVFPAISRELKVVARIFATLQEDRHEADYDLATLFSKAQAREAIKSAEQAFLLLDSTSTEFTQFFILLGVAGQIRNR
jgi:hypothetical protein